MSLALIVALPFLGALLPGFAIRHGRDACARVTGAVTALALAGLMWHAPAVLGGAVVQTRIAWVPVLGLDANFRLDGLGLLFGGLILGIGLLIILYARHYIAARDPMGRFYTFLLLFQGAMTGIVLSDNILLLLVFWELTSLTSFLLIGYWQHLPAARQGARMALAVTGGGGLALIAGMLILGQAAGSYDLSVILTRGAQVQASPWYLPALILILLGAFTKSAQVPFHFWLPQAMAAPTPVSAYLHSATMVKAGIFLMARLWPVLAGTPEWVAIVATTGLATMLLGAAVALFKHDLKAILAYSTVSQLGLVTMLLGFGTKAAVIAAMFHILNHATFKAALFMLAGIVDHATHTRDIRRLGGVRRLMPVAFALTTVAGLSMAGIPPLNGFLSKEMMLEEAAHAVWAGNSWIFPALATIGAALSVGYSFRLVAATFLGPVRRDYPHYPHDPEPGLLAGPMVLVGLVVMIGLAPMLLAAGIVEAAAGAVTGGAVAVKLSLWHGPVPALWMSAAAIGGGVMLVGGHGALARFWAGLPGVDATDVFAGLLRAATFAARRVTGTLHDATVIRSFAIAVLTIVAAGVFAFATGTHAPGIRAATPVTLVSLVGWAALMAATVGIVLLHHGRLLSLVLVGVIGLIVSGLFAYMSAPDLALTQILVEVATVILLLLALNFLPKRTPPESSQVRRGRDAVLAGLAGLGTGGLIYAILTRDFAFPSIAAYHVANAKTEGGGTNIVNVILVDFRGYDTFGEIVVLGIAGLVISALTASLLTDGAAAARLRGWVPDQARAGDPHPLLLVIATRALLPIVLLVAAYLLLRGHNQPGGGFIAGLLVAIGLVMQFMASGLRWTEGRRRIDYTGLIALGVLAALATGLGAVVASKPFLTSAFGYVSLPPLETFELATAALFDLGVFLTVLGAVLLTLSSISRIGLRATRDRKGG